MASSTQQSYVSLRTIEPIDGNILLRRFGLLLKALSILFK